MDLLLWLGILAVLLIIEAATVGLVTVWCAGSGDRFRGRRRCCHTVAVVSGSIPGIIVFYQTACCQIYETGNSQNKCE